MFSCPRGMPEFRKLAIRALLEFSRLPSTSSTVFIPAPPRSTIRPALDLRLADAYSRPSAHEHNSMLHHQRNLRRYSLKKCFSHGDRRNSPQAHRKIAVKIERLCPPGRRRSPPPGTHGRIFYYAKRKARPTARCSPHHQELH